MSVRDTRRRTYVNEHKVGVTAVVSDAGGYLRAQRSRTVSSIGGGRIAHVRYEIPEDGRIEEVVDEIHLAARVALGSVDVAVESSIRDIVSSFPNIREL